MNPVHPNFYFHNTLTFTEQLVLLPRLPDTKFTSPTITIIVGRILVDYSVYYGVSYPRTRNILSLPKLRMETLKVDSCIQGYHVFKSIWNPTTGEELNCVRERTNTEDPYAVAVICRSAVVGHVPRKMSAVCALFLR